MEALKDGEQEIMHRNEQAAGLEVQLVWNALIDLAYSKVEDKQSGESFMSIAPDGVHPLETFYHPFIYRVRQPGEEEQATQRRLYAATEADQPESD